MLWVTGPVTARTSAWRGEATGKGFRATTGDGRRYEGRALIYCAGKEYKRLEVPGEAKFLGKGIAFCATCDAPLYTGRRVAVVGGETRPSRR